VPSEKPILCKTEHEGNSTGLPAAWHANVDADVLHEILYVYEAQKKRVKRFDTIDNFLVLFPNPIAMTREEIEAARDLMRAHSFLAPATLSTRRLSRPTILRESLPPIKSLTE